MKPKGEKKNICGSIKLPADINFLNALNEKTTTVVGWPPYRYPLAIAIIKEGSTPEEFDYLTKGYGLGVERITQNEIAAMYGKDANYVSRTINRAVEKLRQPKYKKRLNALVPTMDELYEALENKDNNQDLADRLVKAHRTINGQKAGIAERDARIAELEKCLKEEKQSSATLRKQLTSAETELSQVKQHCNTLSNENAMLNLELSNVRENANVFMKNCGFMTEEGRRITAQKFEELFKGEILETLNRVQIFDFDMLCRNTPRTLINLRVSERLVKLIEKKLRSVGMHLREG